MRPNIIVFVIDTLRADHLSCYGYFRKTSPTIDKLAKEGVLFENFYASGIPTGPGFTSIITGLYPISHKYYITPYAVPNTYQLDDNIPVLAEILWDNGYTTVAVDNLINWPSHPKHFVRGYEYYLNPTKGTKWSGHRPGQVRADQVNEKIISWLKEHVYEPFFLFVHYWDPHMPYNQPEDFKRKFKHEGIKGLKVIKAVAGYEYVPGWGRVDQLPKESEDKSIDLYDGEILYVDNAISEVLEVLEDENILDDTLIIVTSDHGEQLGQHVIWGHAGLHEAVVKIPLIMRCPKFLPQNLRVRGYAQHVDLVPTILELAGIKTTTRFDGESLLKLIDGNEIREFAVCETWGERCIVKGEWKLIIHYETEIKKLKDVFLLKDHYKGWLPFLEKYGNIGIELYNIKKDPSETINLAKKEENVVKELKGLLEDWVLGHLKGDVDPILVLEKYTQPQSIEYQKL